MIISLIGMSGVGKSYWATKLADCGFTVFDCDLLIAGKLQQQLGLAGTSLADIGRWMGFPHEPGFQHREALYLKCEAEILRDILDRMSGPQSSPGKYVIDTSGSVVYAEPELLRRLKQQSTVVYFRIPQTIHQQMLSAYLEHPRPLIWGGLFHQAPDEGLDTAFRRNYPRLIRHRESLYEQYSHIPLDYDEYRRAGLHGEQLLQLVARAAGPAGNRGPI